MTTDDAAIQRFFERYGEALSSGDLPAIARCWEMPALFLSDQGARPVSSFAEVEALFATAVEWSHHMGLMSTRPEIERIERLGLRLVSVDLRWPAFDAKGAERSSERSRHVLSLAADGEPRIRVAITRAEG
jgi:ketosteroid isomerase-like protein